MTLHQSLWQESRTTLYHAWAVAGTISSTWAAQVSQTRLGPRPNSSGSPRCQHWWMLIGKGHVW